jgi:hypothetical protein
MRQPRRGTANQLGMQASGSRRGTAWHSMGAEFVQATVAATFKQPQQSRANTQKPGPHIHW